jgi:hypothetical protein
MLTIGLPAVPESETAANVGKITKTATFFGANLLYAENLTYKGAKAPKYRSGKFNDKYLDI